MYSKDICFESSKGCWQSCLRFIEIFLTLWR